MQKEMGSNEIKKVPVELETPSFLCWDFPLVEDEH